MKGEGEIDRDFYCQQTDLNYCEDSDMCKKHPDVKTCVYCHRKYPTPEQFIDEYGYKYSDDGAVYTLKEWTGETNPSWDIMHYSSAKLGRKLIICACTPWGKPPDNWRPEKLCFNISGDFITDLARDWLYAEKRPYEKVEDFLLASLSGTDHSETELKEFAHDILTGKRKLTGNTSDGTYCMVDDNTDIMALYPLYYENKPVEKVVVEIPAGDCGAANAGNRGAANAGDRGASMELKKCENCWDRDDDRCIKYDCILSEAKMKCKEVYI